MIETDFKFHTTYGSDQSLAGAKPVQFWKGEQGIAFAYDAALPLPVFYEVCDVIYAEPAWCPGYNEFHRRAGIVPRLPWSEWIKTIERHVRALGKPAVIQCGKQGSKLLQPDHFIPLRITLANFVAMAAIYGPVGEIEALDDTAIIAELAGRFDTVGDFACGYGRTGRIFNQHGKRFVMSDISAECIGYIAEQAGSWA